MPLFGSSEPAPAAPNCPRCKSEDFTTHEGVVRPSSKQNFWGGAYFDRVYYVACTACGCIVGTFAEPKKKYWKE